MLNTVSDYLTQAAGSLPFLLPANIPAYAFSDRFIGGGFGWDKLTVDHGGPLHGRGSYYVALPLLLLGYLTGGLLLLLLALLWLLYRAAQGNDDGVLDGRNLKSTLIHHSGVLLFIGFYAMVTTQPLVFAAFATYAGIAIALATLAGLGLANRVAEVTRGGAWGAAMVITALLQHPLPQPV